MSLQKFENTSFGISAKKASRLLSGAEYKGLNLASLVVVKEEKAPSVDELVSEKLKAEKVKINAEVEKMAAIGSQLSMALSAFAAQKEEYFTKIKQEATTLAIDIARKLIGEELKVNPSIVETMVSTLIHEVGVSEKKVLEINPQDLNFLTESKVDFINNLKSMDGLEIRPVDTIPVGVVRLTMDNQVLETGPAKKIEHLWQELIAKGYVKESSGQTEV